MWPRLDTGRLATKQSQANGQRQLAGERVPCAMGSRRPRFGGIFWFFCFAVIGDPGRVRPAVALATLPPCGSRHTFAWLAPQPGLRRVIMTFAWQLPVSSLTTGLVNGLYRAAPFLGPDAGLRPGLTEAALQAACLLRLILDGIGTPPRQHPQPLRWEGFAYSRLSRRTASVSWLVNACRARWACEGPVFGLFFGVFVSLSVSGHLKSACEGRLTTASGTRSFVAFGKREETAVGRFVLGSVGVP